MIKDSDRRNHPNPHIKYVDRGNDLGMENVTDRIFWVISFYITYHAGRHLSGRYMKRATSILLMTKDGGEFDVTHEDFRCIIACALFCAEHIHEVSDEFSRKRGLKPSDDGMNEEAQKSKQFAEYLLDGDFKDTLPKSKQNQFKAMRNNHASFKSLLKL